MPDHADPVVSWAEAKGDAAGRPIRSAEPGPWHERDLLFWSVLAALFAALFVRFRAFAAREVAWGYPFDYDQTKYLWISYSAWERLWRDGAGPALAALVRDSAQNGPLIHMEALILFFLFGVSRLTALSLHYVNLLAHVAVFTAVVKYLTASRRLALLGTGLAFGAGPFWFGGQIDYRLDFSAMCVFGIFVSLVMRSDVFRRRGWSMAAGIAAGATILFRYLSAPYVAAIYGAMLLYYLVVWKRGRSDDAAWRLRHVLESGAVGAAIALPFVWFSRTAIYGYYVLRQGLGSLPFPAHGALETAVYYPRSLLTDHVGGPLALASVLALALAGLVGWRRVPGRPPATGARDQFVFLAICAAVVLVTLTAYSTRSPGSPTVVGILVPVLSWAVTLACLALLRPRLAAGHRIARRAATAVAAIALVIAFWGQMAHYARHTALWLQRRDVRQITELYDAIGAYSEQAGWPAPIVAADSMRDYFWAGALRVWYYERHGRLIEFGGVLGATGSVDAPPRHVLLAQLAAAHFLILAHRADPVEYPFAVVRALEEIRPDMETFARANLKPLGQYRIFGRAVDLYARPATP